MREQSSLNETAPARKPASLSVVVPVFDEEANAEPLVRGVLEAVRPLGLPFELIVVDDGSRDATAERLLGLLPEAPELVVVRLARNFGQTLALQAGFDRARGEAIVTMDGDLQNDPRDIGRLLAGLAHADVVSGWRRDRQDTLLLRKIPSRVANLMIRRLTGVAIHDQGCSLKAYRREIVKGLDLYADMHRFIATLTLPLGATIDEIEVRHHARLAGTSKYGISRVFKVIVDLLTLQMLIRFRGSPLRWFALLGSPFLLASLLGGVGVLCAWPGPVIVASAATLLTATTFVCCIFWGLVAELVIELAGRRRARPVVAREWAVAP